MSMLQTLSRVEDEWSGVITDALEFLAEAPRLWGWLLAILLLVVAGSVTVVYLIVKLFIPRKYYA